MFFWQVISQKCEPINFNKSKAIRIKVALARGLGPPPMPVMTNGMIVKLAVATELSLSPCRGSLCIYCGRTGQGERGNVGG